jgi:hypothetical protein
MGLASNRSFLSSSFSFAGGHFIVGPSARPADNHDAPIFVPVRTRSGEHSDAAVRREGRCAHPSALHQRKTAVPVLERDGRIVQRSGAIIEYLETELRAGRLKPGSLASARASGSACSSALCLI